MSKKEKLKELQAKLMAAKSLQERLELTDKIRELEGKKGGDYQRPECVGCGA